MSTTHHVRPNGRLGGDFVDPHATPAGHHRALDPDETKTAAPGAGRDLQDVLAGRSIECDSPADDAGCSAQRLDVDLHPGVVPGELKKDAEIVIDGVRVEADRHVIVPVVHPGRRHLPRNTGQVDPGEHRVKFRTVIAEACAAAWRIDQGPRAIAVAMFHRRQEVLGDASRIVRTTADPLAGVAPPPTRSAMTQTASSIRLTRSLTSTRAPVVDHEPDWTNTSSPSQRGPTSAARGVPSSSRVAEPSMLTQRIAAPGHGRSPRRSASTAASVESG